MVPVLRWAGARTATLNPRRTVNMDATFRVGIGKHLYVPTKAYVAP
jgi:hypothetical protein